jgi:F0F1-type ATP synthase membrane subunit a
MILLFLYNRWPKKENYKVLGKVMALICILVNFAPGIQLFFNLFEGFIQAFVISLLTSMYISSEISSEGH